jgi:hypothetical protein
VKEKSATGSGQFFRKTFKKSLKMLIPLQDNLQYEPYAGGRNSICCVVAGREGAYVSQKPKPEDEEAGDQKLSVRSSGRLPKISMRSTTRLQICRTLKISKATLYRALKTRGEDE